MSLRFLRSLGHILLPVLVAVLGLASLAVAANLTATVSTNIAATYRGTNDLGSPSYELSRSLQPSIAFTSGTSTYQVDLMFSDQRTLAASATENLDLAGGLTDPLGATLTFAKIKVIKICAARANANNVVVGGAASNTFVGPFVDATDKVAVAPGGCAVLVAPASGWTVTASTGDILLVANSGAGTGVTYDIVVLGTSS